MGFWAKNLGALKRSDPDLARKLLPISVPQDYVTGGKMEHAPGLKIGPVTVHSFYNPLAEADAFAEAQAVPEARERPLLIFGLGLGYHVKALARRFPDRELIVVEPREGVVRLAMETVDLAELMDRTRFVVSDDSLTLAGHPVIRTYIDEGHVPVLIAHRPSVRGCEKAWAALSEALWEEEDPPAGSLRILVVSPIYGGSLPITHYAADALRSLGHQVAVIDNTVHHPSMKSVEDGNVTARHRTVLRERFLSFLSESILAECAAYKPDGLSAVCLLSRCCQEVLGAFTSHTRRERVVKYRSQ